MENKDICVLFGAGAEENFNICNGINFAKFVLGIDCDVLNSAIREYYSEIFSNSDAKVELSNWYPKYNGEQFEYEKLLEASIRKKYLSINNSTNKNKTKIEEEIKTQVKNGAKLEDKYISYMGVIDGSFHTLIRPKILGPNKFWRVINCYTRAYCEILGEMNNAKNKEDYLKILYNPKDSIEIMKKYAEKYSGINNYYTVIKNYQNINVVTTNYTTLCETISGINKEKIAYIHGKFGWFESAKELTVYDVSDDDLPDDDILFPYIFIQSGVKPIVEDKQLSEYMKMIKYIKDSYVIFVVGFNLNVDDNHINAMLKSAIRNNKKIIIFNYDNNLDEDVVCYALRLSDNQKDMIEFVDINRENCYDEFKKKLRNIQMC